MPYTSAHGCSRSGFAAITPEGGSEVHDSVVHF
jgi:hypothetical protein